MASDGQQLPPPREGLYSFVKLGVLVPARGCRLFIKIFALAAVSSTVLFLVETLVLERLAVIDFEVYVGADAVSDTVRRFLSDHLWLLLGGAGSLITDVVLGWAMKMATVFAAISACHPDHDHNLGSVLDRMKRNVWGPVVTACFGFILRAAYVLGMAVSTLPLLFLQESYSPQMLAAHQLLDIGARFFYCYLEVVCAVALVASAAEPGLRCLDAVRRAWGLMRDTKAQLALYATAKWAVRITIRLLYRLATLWLPPSATAGVVRPIDAALAYTLRSFLDVFSIALVAAYYFFWRNNSNDDDAGSRRLKEE